MSDEDKDLEEQLRKELKKEAIRQTGIISKKDKEEALKKTQKKIKNEEKKKK
jgi:hypothetical protein